MSSRAADRPENLFLEDFTPGQRFSTASVEVTADEIKAFAARFDPQPFHLDEEAAKRSVFGALAASGWHTAAMTMRQRGEPVQIAVVKIMVPARG